jgi:hypothetical protein
LASCADVTFRALVAIIARRAVGCEDAALRRIAAIISAWILVITTDSHTDAHTQRTDITAGAKAVIVAL